MQITSVEIMEQGWRGINIQFVINDECVFQIKLVQDSLNQNKVCFSDEIYHSKVDQAPTFCPFCKREAGSGTKTKCFYFRFHKKEMIDLLNKLYRHPGIRLTLLTDFTFNEKSLEFEEDDVKNIQKFISNAYERGEKIAYITKDYQYYIPEESIEVVEFGNHEPIWKSLNITELFRESMATFVDINGLELKAKIKDVLDDERDCLWLAEMDYIVPRKMRGKSYTFTKKSIENKKKIFQETISKNNLNEKIESPFLNWCEFEGYQNFSFDHFIRKVIKVENIQEPDFIIEYFEKLTEEEIIENYVSANEKQRYINYKNLVKAIKGKL